MARGLPVEPRLQRIAANRVATPAVTSILLGFYIVVGSVHLGMSALREVDPADGWVDAALPGGGWAGGAVVLLAVTGRIRGQARALNRAFADQHQGVGR